MSRGITYKTDGVLHLDCVESTSRPVAVKWVKGGGVVNLHNGGDHISVSPAQQWIRGFFFVCRPAD